MMLVKIWTNAFKVAGCGLLLLAASTQAQDLRDPTVPPTRASGALGVGAQSSLESEATSVIVRDGKAGLVDGTRVVFPGQKWGRWTLERITETEVWLREGKTQRKLQRFNGIQRTDAAVRMATCAAHSAASASALGSQRKKSKTHPTSTPADAHCDAHPTRSSNP